MIHRLCAIIAVVDHNAKTLLKILLRSTLLRNKQQMTKQSTIIFLCIRQLWHVQLWNYEEVRWSLRTDVVERDTLFVFVNQLRGNIFAQYFREDGVSRVFTIFSLGLFQKGLVFCSS